jgi:dihydroorotate dehydrogenase
MPDFSYVIYRPLVTRLFSAEGARRLTLSAMELQGRLAAGRAIFRWMAQATPNADLAVRAMGLDFPSPVGIAPHIDIDGSALGLWPFLGAGFVVIGPCSSRSDRQKRTGGTHLIHQLCSIVVTPESPCATVQQVRHQLSNPRGRAVPVGVLLRGPALEEPVRRIGSLADFFILPPLSDPVRLRELRQATDRPLLLELLIGPTNKEVFHEVEAAVRAGFEGCVAIAGSKTNLLPGGRLHGPYLRDEALGLVAALKRRFGSDLTIVGGGGILTPGDVQAFLECGATLVPLFEGLIFAGPGLPKRANQRLLAARKRDESTTAAQEDCTAKHWRPQAKTVRVDTVAQPQPAAAEGKRATGWARVGSWGLAAAALSLIGAGVLSIVLAATTVLLPRELDTLQVPLEKIAATAEGPLIPFIAHNRVCLAGALTCLGAIYLWLALVPIRRGEPWAWLTLLISVLGGATAWVAALEARHLLGAWFLTGPALLFTLCALALYCTRMPATRFSRSLFRPGASAWLWSPAGRGRVMIGIWGAGLLVGGASIMAVGVTSVLVPQDLTYLGYGLSSIRTIDQALVTIIARDRISFGACLFAAGLAALPTIWCGFRPGRMKLLLVLGLAAVCELGAAIGVHPLIGYNDFGHLLPFLLKGLAFLTGAFLLGQALLREKADAQTFQDLWLPIERPPIPVPLQQSSVRRSPQLLNSP